jgi:hypothetical protein
MSNKFLKNKTQSQEYNVLLLGHCRLEFSLPCARFVRQKKKAEEDATFYLMKDGALYPLFFLSNKPDTALTTVQYNALQGCDLLMHTILLT